MACSIRITPGRCGLANMRAVCLVLMFASQQGCATVEAWQRGDLARRDMAAAPEPALAALRAHVQTSKEAAQGGFRGVNGGCGCN